MTDRTSGSREAPRSRPVVMADVARLAGVSHQTVSRVLNDPRIVRPATRARVLAAIRELDYRPNTAARALVTGRTRTIGVVAFDTRLYGPASTLHAIQQASADAGYAVSIVSLEALEQPDVLRAVGRLRDQAVEGIILIAPEVSMAQALRELPPGLPMVAVEGLMEAPIPVVAVDQYSGAVRATQHLLDLGHRTVWHVSGPADWYEARARQAGWQHSLEAVGAPVPEVLPGDWSPEAGYRSGRELGRRFQTDDVTAVFVANDQMALGMLRAMYEVGIVVPRDVSVVGFDDIPEAAYFPPPLTTVRQAFTQVGVRAMALLLEHLHGEPPPATTTIVDADLVVRASTGPPKA